MPVELEVSNHFWLKKAAHVGSGRDLVPREDLFRRAGPTDDGPRFKDQRLEPGLLQVTGRDQPVMAGPNNNGIVGLHVCLIYCRRCLQLCATIL